MGKLDREAQISEASALDLSDALFSNRKGGAMLRGLEKAGRIRLCDRNVKSGETVIFSRTGGFRKQQWRMSKKFEIISLSNGFHER
jgi:hypothetical protein